MWSNPATNQPAKETARSICGVSSKPLRLQPKATFGSIEHRLRGLDLVVRARGGWFNVDNDCVLDVNEIVEPVSELHAFIGFAVQADDGSEGEITFGGLRSSFAVGVPSGVALPIVIKSLSGPSVAKASLDALANFEKGPRVMTVSPDEKPRRCVWVHRRGFVDLDRAVRDQPTESITDKVHKKAAGVIDRLCLEAKRLMREKPSKRILPRKVEAAKAKLGGPLKMDAVGTSRTRK